MELSKAGWFGDGRFGVGDCGVGFLAGNAQIP